MAETATLKRLSYRSFGPELSVDVLSAEFTVDGVIYTHDVPNNGWSYQAPSLMIIAALDLRPTVFDNTSLKIEKEIPVEWDDEHGQYLLSSELFGFGLNKLKQAEWFDPDGDVSDNEPAKGVGGASADPSTGNRAAVETTKRSDV